MPRLTLYGMYNFDSTLFDSAPMPDGIKRSVLIDMIIEHSGDLYPYYQNAAMLKKNITNWFSVRKEDFSRMYNALYSDYNPIENYDRHEDSTDTSHAEGISNVSAYNSSDYEPDGQSKSDGALTRVSRIHGNIGVTTNQQMISAELQLREQNLYDYIVRAFEEKFIVQVY